MKVGIEEINFYTSPACLDVRTLFEARGLQLDRFDNLLMETKSVDVPCEDPVTYGVNAAKPFIDQMSEEDRASIELVITASESSLDFGKSMSTYIHDYLGLSRNCRLFEVKQACYSGTAALHMCVNFVASGVSPGAKALVIATDSPRAFLRMSYAEPSQAVGAIAMLVSDKPDIMEIDFGATGYYGYEVMDACRPDTEIETGDADLTLLSYLECLENSFIAYSDKVEEADYKNSFDYLAFHTPFAGMVKGGHRKMMRKFLKADRDEIDSDYAARVSPSLKYCTQVGNVYSATTYLALTSLIDNTKIKSKKRVGVFSYGSGCSSEFYSGIISPDSRSRLSKMNISRRLNDRLKLSIEEYDELLELNSEWQFGIKNKEMDYTKFAHIYENYIDGKGVLTLNRIKNYHREYIWS